ncbi:MAG: GSCFA domain-containing protein [Muribaculaceae bacterium]
MEFRTTIKTEYTGGLMSHDSPVMLLGSCFSDSIGQRMRSAMMQATVNPFGALYNPLSIATSLQKLVDGYAVDGADMVQSSGLWQSYLFHSRWGKTDKMRAMETMNKSISDAANELRRTRVLILTLGSAIVYRLKSTGRVVSNCHKQPQHIFSREMLQPQGMVTALADALNALWRVNPGVHVIITVSPIRHIADGLAANQLSKSMLRVAAYQLCEMFGNKVSYFPSYEIMIDDLRDYRFYAPDMVHPSDVAVEYIWQTFQATYFDDRTAQAVARCERVWKRLMHRPITAATEAQQRFAIDTRAIVTNLVKEYPHIAEIKEINNYLQQ